MLIFFPQAVAAAAPSIAAIVQPKIAPAQASITHNQAVLTTNNAASSASLVVFLAHLFAHDHNVNSQNQESSQASSAFFVSVLYCASLKLAGISRLSVTHHAILSTQKTSPKVPKSHHDLLAEVTAPDIHQAVIVCNHLEITSDVSALGETLSGTASIIENKSFISVYNSV